MEINQIKDAIYSAIAHAVSKPAFSVTPVSENRMYVQLVVPGFAVSKLRVKSKKSNLYVSGVDTESPLSLYKPTPFSIFFPLCGMTVESVDLREGVLRIAMTLEHPDAEKEYQINIPQPKSHPHYLTEDSVL